MQPCAPTHRSAMTVTAINLLPAVGHGTGRHRGKPFAVCALPRRTSRDPLSASAPLIRISFRQLRGHACRAARDKSSRGAGDLSGPSGEEFDHTRVVEAKVDSGESTAWKFSNA